MSIVGKGYLMTDQKVFGIVAALCLFCIVGCDLTVTNSGGGTVTSNDENIQCGKDCKAAYDTATTVTLTAAPDPGYTFVQWSGDCQGETGPWSLNCEVTIDNRSEKTVSARFQPSVPEELHQVRQISEGGTHSCAVTADGVQCWGLNNGGAIAVPDDLGDVTQIDATIHGTCALDEKGVHCWGSGGSSSGMPEVPWELRRYNITQIDVEQNAFCALDDTGKVHCWGHGQDDSVRDDMGCGALNPGALVPPEDLGHVSRVVLGAVDTGDMLLVRIYHACAITDKGVRCWGDGSSTLNVPEDLGEVTQLYAGGDSTCAVDENGVHCWGNWMRRPETSRPVTVPEGLGRVSQMALGETFTCAVDENGLQCWTFEGRKKELPRDFGPIQQISAAGAYDLLILCEDALYHWNMYSDELTVIPVK